MDKPDAGMAMLERVWLIFRDAPRSDENPEVDVENRRDMTSLKLKAK